MPKQVRSSSEFLQITWKREKSRYLCDSSTDLHKICHDDAEHVYQVRRPLQMYFTIQDSGRPIRLRDPFCIITRYCNFPIFKMAAVRHIVILKLKFLAPITSETRSAFAR